MFLTFSLCFKMLSIGKIRNLTKCRTWNGVLYLNCQVCSVRERKMFLINAMEYHQKRELFVGGNVLCGNWF